jgi:hypothetical protein
MGKPKLIEANVMFWKHVFKQYLYQRPNTLNEILCGLQDAIVETFHPEDELLKEKELNAAAVEYESVVEGIDILLDMPMLARLDKVDDRTLLEERQDIWQMEPQVKRLSKQPIQHATPGTIIDGVLVESEPAKKKPKGEKKAKKKEKKKAKKERKKAKGSSGDQSLTEAHLKNF